MLASQVARHLEFIARQVELELIGVFHAAANVLAIMLGIFNAGSSRGSPAFRRTARTC